MKLLNFFLTETNKFERERLETKSLSHSLGLSSSINSFVDLKKKTTLMYLSLLKSL